MSKYLHAGQLESNQFIAGTGKQTVLNITNLQSLSGTQTWLMSDDELEVFPEVLRRPGRHEDRRHSHRLSLLFIDQLLVCLLEKSSALVSNHVYLHHGTGHRLRQIGSFFFDGLCGLMLAYLYPFSDISAYRL